MGTIEVIAGARHKARSTSTASRSPVANACSRTFSLKKRIGASCRAYVRRLKSSARVMDCLTHTSPTKLKLFPTPGGKNRAANVQGGLRSYVLLRGFPDDPLPSTTTGAERPPTTRAVPGGTGVGRCDAEYRLMASRFRRQRGHRPPRFAWSRYLPRTRARPWQRSGRRPRRNGPRRSAAVPMPPQCRPP